MTYVHFVFLLSWSIIAQDVLEEMMAERAAKAEISRKFASRDGNRPEVRRPVLEREVEKTGMLIENAHDEALDALRTAKKKLNEAVSMMEKASMMDVTIESLMDESFRKQQEKANQEIDTLQRFKATSALRKRDARFVQKEMLKIQQDRESATQALRSKAQLSAKQQSELQKKAQIMKMEAEADLDEAQKRLSDIEALAQQNDDPSRSEPTWMVHAELAEAKQSAKQQQAVIAKKRAFWKKEGMELTCAQDAPEVHVFILDSKKDESNRAICLERQLSKYCLKHQRVPTIGATQALHLNGMEGDCLPLGLDKRVADEQKGITGARWCTMLMLLQAVSAQPRKYQFFLVLEDDVKVDQKSFEEVVVGFAKRYKHDPWSLAQLDPFGQHSEVDDDMLTAFDGLPVFRNTRNGQYLGFHAVLIKTAFAPLILQKMISIPAVPLDSFPTILNEEACEEGGCRMTMPTAVAVQAFVTETPKANPYASALVARETMPRVCLDEVAVTSQASVHEL
eukprot:gnl/MRDRNA2_/MRDRNA2_141900_c0_seq1.p1 gnl/MRDRNA2_/MRDRNA2_141900_c0~~gnl/MRDRNA2_/MRDRNA2_141900_c0_seq1.p1  ORF type:complete len:509 (-),score=125.33 gnl/MRDRNA2_/MRDRNA2_141900_c0_seq1:86-1612(-)